MTTCIPRVAAAVLVAASLAACGGAAQVSSEPAEPSVSASQSEPPSLPAIAPASSVRVVLPSPSDRAWCLPAEVIAAIREVADGNLAPAIPLSEVADALEALDLSQEGRFIEVRDELVMQLRHPDPERQQGLDLVHVANLFLSDAGALSDSSHVEC